MYGIGDAPAADAATPKINSKIDRKDAEPDVLNAGASTLVRRFRDLQLLAGGSRVEVSSRKPASKVTSWVPVINQVDAPP